MTAPRGSAVIGIGSGALVRIAGVPITVWLEGGNPELFAAASDLEAARERHTRLARAAAAAIGDRLVPHPAVDGPARAAALHARRALHQGATTPGLATVAGLAERLLPGDRLGADLREIVELAAAIDAARAEVERRAADEERRLLDLPWRLLHEQVFARHAVRAGDLATYADIAARLAAGEPWHTKRMRQRSDYLWRMLARAATRATPRGWLAHVVPLTVGDGWNGSGELSILDLAAADNAENLEHSRSSASSAVLGDPACGLAVAPLHRLDPEHLRVWTLSGEHNTSLGEVRLRRSVPLDAVLGRLCAGPAPIGALLDDLAGDDPAQREVLTGLLSHLVRLEVLQVCAEPRHSLTTWQPAARIAAAPKGDDDFTDVYRVAATGLDRDYAHRAAGLVELALRLGALADADAPAPIAKLPAAIGTEPRPVLEIVADCLDTDVTARRGAAHHHDWPQPSDPESGYARLLDWLRPHLDGHDPIDIDAATLDRFGAPPADLHWPMDCLIRPMIGDGDLLGTLSQVTPAGSLDARFVPGLRALGADVPQAAAYREFLDALGDTVPFVEILVPPLTYRAANAVRRPAYTPLWTGDPDRAGYTTDGDAGYLPLSQITLRRDGRRVVAEADGMPVWPVLHTSRIAPAPWATLVDLLLLASPQPVRTHWRAMPFSLTAWPHRRSMPRITVGGGLIVSPAQWRIDLPGLWGRHDPLPAKVAALARLRRRYHLPRLVTAVADPHEDPLGVDLTSRNAIRLIDRHLQRGVPRLLLREFPAAPDQLAVHDDGSDGPVVAELLLRLPLATPAEAARRAAAQLRLHGHSAGSAAHRGDHPQPGRKHVREPVLRRHRRRDRRAGGRVQPGP